MIADLVTNHTSSDHPWFQESRSSPDSPKRDWYVWSDTDERYGDARVVFSDAETSNWTWDPVAGQFYWHRFFHHNAILFSLPGSPVLWHGQLRAPRFRQRADLRPRAPIRRGRRRLCP